MNPSSTLGSLAPNEPPGWISTLAPSFSMLEERVESVIIHRSAVDVTPGWSEI